LIIGAPSCQPVPVDAAVPTPGKGLDSGPLPADAVLFKTRGCPGRDDRLMTSELMSIPNVGPAVAAKLARLGIGCPDDLRGCDAGELFERLCVLDGCSHDLCLLDTFEAAVCFVNGGGSRPWWEFSRERKARAAG
jgi:hypothetical protein